MAQGGTLGTESREGVTQAEIAAKLLPQGYRGEVIALAVLAGAGMLAPRDLIEFEYPGAPMMGKPEFQRDGTVVWRSRCPRCHEPSEVRKLDPFAVRRWEEGMHVLEAFPHLSATDRETLISGLHDECFELWFAPPPDPG